MNTRTIAALAACLLLAPAACSPGAAPAEPAAPAIALEEASGIVVRGDGKVAVIGGDETPDRLWGVSLDDFTKRWNLPFPPGSPQLHDIEALAPWGKDGVLVVCSQSRTKPKEKIKIGRHRLALVTLSPDARKIIDMRVYDGLRDYLLTHLRQTAAAEIENLDALSLESPLNAGLNVEGLAVWKGELLVGLRSPGAKGGRAIVIPIRGPEKLFDPGAAGKAPDFGKPLFLPTVAGEGVRDMAATDDGVLVLLGAQTDAKDPPYRVVRWNPETGRIAPVHVKGLRDVGKPEGIAPDPQGWLLVVQDLKSPGDKAVLFCLEMRDGP